MLKKRSICGKVQGKTFLKRFGWFTDCGTYKLVTSEASISVTLKIKFLTIF